MGWQVRLGPNIEFLRLIVAKGVFVNWVELGLGGGGGVGWSEVGVETRFFGSRAGSMGHVASLKGRPGVSFGANRVSWVDSRRKWSPLQLCKNENLSPSHFGSFLTPAPFRPTPPGGQKRPQHRKIEIFQKIDISAHKNIKGSD